MKGALRQLLFGGSSLTQELAAVGVSGVGMAVWLPDYGVTVDGGVVTHHLDVINGYDASPPTEGAEPVVNATGWQSTQPTISYSGSQALVCTAAALLAAYSGDDTNTAILLGRVAADEASVWRAGFNGPTEAYRCCLRNGSNTHEYYYRNTLYIGGQGCSTGETYVIGQNIGTQAALLENGLEQDSGTKDANEMSWQSFSRGARWVSDALSEGATMEEGPVALFNPATVDLLELLALFARLGYGAN